MARARAAARTPAPPRLAGHHVRGPAGFGANGPAWLAQTTAGQDVVVSVLPLPAGPAGRGQLRRLAALRHASHPHLARVREVVAMAGDRCAVVSDRVHGPGLDTVVRARGHLSDGEQLAMLHALATALAHLHSRGVVHGDVAPGNVVLSSAGDPVLVDLAGQVTHELGTEGFVPPERQRGAPATAAGDVWSLARLVQWSAGPTPPRELIDLLGEALRAAPERRPEARELARSAAAAGSYRPLTLPSAAALAHARMQTPEAVTRRRSARDRRPARTTEPARPAARHAAPRDWRPARVVTLGLTVVAVLGAAALALVPWPRDPDVLDQAGATAAVSELLDRRDTALMARDDASLGSVSVPGSPAARADSAVLAALEATGTVLTGLRTSVAEIRAVGTVADGTAVDVVLEQAPHTRTHGDDVVAVPAPDSRCSRLVLQSASDVAEWRLLRATACP